jgi:hypothetical protein
MAKRPIEVDSEDESDSHSTMVYRLRDLEEEITLLRISIRELEGNVGEAQEQSEAALSGVGFVEGRTKDLNKEVDGKVWKAIHDLESYVDDLKERDYGRAKRKREKEQYVDETDSVLALAVADITLLQEDMKSLKRKQRNFQTKMEAAAMHASKRMAILEKYLRRVTVELDDEVGTYLATTLKDELDAADAPGMTASQQDSFPDSC